MDLQAAADGEDLGPDEDAVSVLRRDHQALRKAFVQYRELMDEAAPERAAVAQNIAMQFEMHFAITSDVFYPAISGQAARLVAGLEHAQEDIGECLTALRNAPATESAELDSTMLRLMEMGDVFFCKERELLEEISHDSASLGPLGARMLERRQQIAGSVQDLESRS